MSFEFQAQTRIEQGKGASRRLRRDGQVPAIIYGNHQPAVSITLDHNKINTAQQHDNFYSDVLTIHLDDDKSINVKVKDMQRHAYKPKILHLDFMRV